jgi:hypothetical protein
VNIFVSGVTIEEAVVLLLAQRDGRRWSKYSFPPLLSKKTVVFLLSKRGGGWCNMYFFECPIEKGIQMME